MKTEFSLNAGTGMALGAVVAAVVSLLLFVLFDTDIFLWSMPVGIAVGLAIGAGQAASRESAKEKKGG